MLIEAFVQVVDRDVASHLAQKDITTAEEAATIADNYALAKKDSYMSGSRPDGGGSSFPQHKEKGAHQRPLDPPSQGKGISKPAPTGRQREIFNCSFCGKTEHKADYCWRRLQPKEPAKVVLATQKSPEVETMPVGCVFPSPGEGGHFTTTGDKEVQPDAGYKAFVSRGSVTGGGVTRPVNILRDSGALQTLLRAGVTTGEEIGEWVILSSIGGRNSAPSLRF